MVAHPEDRVAMALHLELAGGRHGASASVTMRERARGRVVLLEVRGWLDRAAIGRLGRTVEDLADRGVDQLLLDCSQVHHIDYRTVPALVSALARFESHAGGVVLCGMSAYLRNLIRVAGGEQRLRCWPSSADLLAAPGACEHGRECAS
jgi:anti-anti-sigma factor